MKLLNRIEEMWYNNRPTGDAWIPCDQVIMGIFFNEHIIKESDTFEVYTFCHESIRISDLGI